MYKNDKKKSVPRYAYFRCGMTHVNFSLNQLSQTCKLPQKLLKREVKHEDVYADTWRNKKDEWMNYVENVIFCTAFSYARYIK